MKVLAAHRINDDWITIKKINSGDYTVYINEEPQKTSKSLKQADIEYENILYNRLSEDDRHKITWIHPKNQELKEP